MNGANRLLNLLTSHVGTGSSWHVLLAAAPISFTSLDVIVSEEAILSAEIVENLWAVGAPLQTPLGELTAPQTPSCWGRGLADPPQEPRPRFRPRFSALRSWLPNEKS